MPKDNNASEWVRKMLEKANTKEPEVKPNTSASANPQEVERLTEDIKKRLQQSGRR